MNTTIFTTVATLQAVEVEINGIKQWRWIVTSFEDDSFQNGKAIDTCEYAETKDKLLKPAIRQPTKSNI